ncbi:MAG TPA: GatB/YqeY domain-containing protein [Eubacterium sp.]|nr:GatB/YqeY domain-containing protein [Lachnospiraceae bacterium]HAZ90483.1 GatB/YqeY domain-containing protein [Eubacterium sp.]HBZ53599.1 GatB/YqeY domain-containing protein [Eubacterium sp.]
MNFETLQKEMIAAMKAKDKDRKEAISTLVSAAKKIAIDEGKRDAIPDEVVERAILKEIKSVKEQIDTCPADRTELLEKYNKTYAVMSEFAPKMLSEDEIKALLNEKYAEVIASKNKGLIMKSVMAELKGKADGKVINKVVEELCK